MTFEVNSEVKNSTSNSVNPGVIIGPDGKQLLLQKGEIRNPHDGEAFVGKYGEILDVGNGSRIFPTYDHPYDLPEGVDLVVLIDRSYYARSIANVARN